MYDSTRKNPEQMAIFKLRFYECFHQYSSLVEWDNRANKDNFFVASLQSDETYFSILNFKLFLHQVVFVTLSQILFVLSLSKHFHVYVQELRDDISLDLTSFDYFQIIQFLSSNVQSIKKRPKFFITSIKSHHHQNYICTFRKVKQVIEIDRGPRTEGL